MKVIIAGGRHTHDVDLVCDALEASGWIPTEIVSGGCRGVDQIGEQIGHANYWMVTTFHADWERGRKAGPERNREMAAYADALVAVWDGQSRGTKNMIDEMRALGKPVYVHPVG